MGSIKDETIARLSGQQQDPEATVNGVKKKAEDMDVVSGAIHTARQLSGANELESEIDRKDKKLEKVEGERDKAIEDKHKAEIETVKTELGAKIDNLAKAYAGGASKDSIADQIAEIKKAASELNMGGSRISEIKDMMNLITTLNPQKSLIDQIKDAKELIGSIAPAADSGKEFAIGGMPATVALELKKMDTNLQITLEQMKDDRQRRDQEFKLTLRKYDDEHLTRQQEVAGKLQVERERNELIAGGLETVGRAIGKGFAEGGGGAGGAAPGIAQRQQGPAQSFHLEIADGEAGEFACPTCEAKGMPNAMVRVEPTSTEAACAWCKSKYPIIRHPATTSEPEPLPT